MTGTDPLNSFEALWELAELLGQVKPPTATKEDIAKSGLEVIRPADLIQYEKDGRVASNCIDRVRPHRFCRLRRLIDALAYDVVTVLDLLGGLCARRQSTSHVVSASVP